MRMKNQRSLRGEKFSLKGRKKSPEKEPEFQAELMAEGVGMTSA